MQKIKNTLVGIFSSLIFFALLNNSHCYALRTVLCTTEEYWKGLLTKAPRRRSPTTNFVVVFSCVALTTTADSALLSELSRKIALLWTSTLKLLCWKKVLLCHRFTKKKRSCKSRQYFYSKSICFTENRLLKLQRKEIIFTMI